MDTDTDTEINANANRSTSQVKRLSLEGLGIILLVMILGEILSTGLKLPLPGNLVGLILLFLVLITGVVRLEQVEATANLLLDNLMLFFIPINLGLFYSWRDFADVWVALLASVVLSTLLVMAVTAKVVEWVEGRRQHVE